MCYNINVCKLPWEGDRSMKEYRADIGALQVIQIMLCLIGAGLSFAAAHFLVRWVRIMWIVVGISAGTAALLALIGLPLFFRRLRCYASGTKITVRAGIFFLREQSIRLDRVQFVQTITGPFDGIFGMNFIVLYVYGGQLTIPFLHKRDRQELTMLLEERGVFHVS